MAKRIGLLVLALAATAPAHATHPVATPAVWAHRGGAALAPENTLGAFKNAAAILSSRGLPVNLELDVHLSKDAVPVVIHDATLDRTTLNCTGRVDAKTAAELGDCDARRTFPIWASVEDIPTLAGVVDAANTSAVPWNLMIEIKGVPTEADFDPAAPAAEAVLDVLLAKGFPASRTIIQSFWPVALDRVELRALQDPRLAGIRTLFLTTSTLPGAPDGAGFTLLENALFSTLRGYEISAPDFECLELSTPTLAPVAVEAAHILGREVITWTVDSLGEFVRLGAAGVDGVITNDPRLLTDPLL